MRWPNSSSPSIISTPTARSSVDGHSWSDAAYATDFNEKWWPPTTGVGAARSRPAYIPAAGHLWDLARRKGLTYHQHGEYATRASKGRPMQAQPGIDALWGHVQPRLPRLRTPATPTTSRCSSRVRRLRGGLRQCGPEQAPARPGGVAARGPHPRHRSWRVHAGGDGGQQRRRPRRVDRVRPLEVLGEHGDLRARG